MKKPIVNLIGRSGDAVKILAACRKAAKTAGWTKAQTDAVLRDMKSADYDHLLQAAMKHFEVQ